MSSILVVDDEPGVRSSVSGVLRDEGFDVDTADTGEECLEKANGAAYDVIVLDIWLPGLDGLTTLQRLRERQIDSQVVIISGHGNIESAVRAIKMGAYDFIEKPLSLEKTVLVVRNALRQRDLEAENKVLRAKVDSQQPNTTMVGESPAMNHLREQVMLAAPTNGRVLILGENGTGKELVARTIHQSSRRKSGPFVEVNRAAIPEELIESELFGHARGAFTGAVADKPGRFEQANAGTIFLDEIADMSLKTQAKVLRVLQEQVMERVGGTQRIKVDVRVLAATNKDLIAEIRAGRFREDLFFRLNVIPIFVPALRDRQQDIPMLAEHFMALVAQEHGRKPRRLASEAAARLQQYGWPGNVRELRNVIERVNIMVGGDTITAQDLGFLGRDGVMPDRPGQAGPVAPLSEARDQFEKDYILRTLAAQHGNMSRTAEVLGVERSNLYKKLRAFGITPRGGT
jgi:two-component system nitrogen regulation response regulator NtrX